MEKDTQRAVKIFYDLQNDLTNPDDTLKSKQLEQLILLLESSFFNKIVDLHKSLNEMKQKKNYTANDNNSAIRDKVNARNLLTPSSKAEFNRRLQLLVGNRELLHVQISRSNADKTLGFSIKCSGALHHNGIFVDDVTKGSLADRSGIKAHYQIVAVDDIPLDSPDSNRDIVVQALKSNQNIIDIYLSREKPTNHLSSSKDTSHNRNRSDHTLVKELKTEWTEYEVIHLKNIDGSFGFGIMAGMAKEVIVRTILSGGAADMDGRLRNDDHIMYINEQPVRHLSSNQVAGILKSAGAKVRLIVARPFDQNSNDNGNVRYDRVQMVETINLDERLQMIVSQLHKNESNGQKLSTTLECAEFLTVELNSCDSKLDIAVVNVNDEDPKNAGTLQGVFIKEVMVDSVAFKKGIRRYDRLLKVNGAPIKHNQTKETVYGLLNSADSVTLNLQRYLSGPSYDRLMEYDCFEAIKIVSVGGRRPLRCQSSLSEGSSVSDFDIATYLNSLK